jgi:hypothetical protein
MTTIGKSPPTNFNSEFGYMNRYTTAIIFSIALSVLVMTGCSDDREGLFNKGVKASATGRHREAIKYFSDILKTKSDGLDLIAESQNRPEVFLERSISALGDGNYCLAAEDATVVLHYADLYRESPAWHPENEQCARVVLATSLVELGFKLKAKSLVDEVLLNDESYKIPIGLLKKLE